MERKEAINFIPGKNGRRLSDPTYAAVTQENRTKKDSYPTTVADLTPRQRQLARQYANEQRRRGTLSKKDYTILKTIFKDPEGR